MGRMRQRAFSRENACGVGGPALLAEMRVASDACGVGRVPLLARMRVGSEAKGGGAQKQRRSEAKVGGEGRRHTLFIYAFVNA